MSKKKKRLTKSQKKRLVLGTLANAVALGGASYLAGPIFGSLSRGIKAGRRSTFRKTRMAKRAYSFTKKGDVIKFKPSKERSYYSNHQAQNIKFKRKKFSKMNKLKRFLIHKKRSNIDDVFKSPDFHVAFSHNMGFFNTNSGIIPKVKKPLRGKEALSMAALGGYFGYMTNKPKKHKMKERNK